MEVLGWTNAGKTVEEGIWTTDGRLDSVTSKVPSTFKIV